MGRSFFKNHLASPARPRVKNSLPMERKPEPVAKPDEKTNAPSACVYDDVSLCRALGLRRKVLADARKEKSRGVDWDCVGLHAGMTVAWITKQAKQLGIDAQGLLAQLTPIRENDGIATVKFLGGHPNIYICSVEVLATRERRFAHVRNQYDHPIFKDEQFDCQLVEGRLEWIASANNVRRY